MSLTKLSGRQIETPVDISAVNLTGITTAANLNVTGVSTLSSAIVGSAVTITSGGIVAGLSTITNFRATHINATGVGTFTGAIVGSAVTITSGGIVAGLGTVNSINATHINVTGVGTFTGAIVGSAVTITSGGIVAGLSTITNFRATHINATGVGTFTGAIVGSAVTITAGGIVAGLGTVNSINATHINSTGIGTLSSAIVGSAVTITAGGIVAGLSTITNFRATHINISGVTTLSSAIVGSAVTITAGGIVAGLSTITNFNATHINISGVTTVAAGSTSAPSITPTGDSNTGIFFPSADTIAFGEGGAEALRIDSSGNVGIGTANLSSISANVANLTLGSRTSATSGGIIYQTTGATAKAYHYYDNDRLIHQSVRRQAFLTNNSNLRMLINESGDTIVGTGATNSISDIIQVPLQVTTSNPTSPTDPSWGGIYSYNGAQFYTTTIAGGSDNDAGSACTFVLPCSASPTPFAGTVVISGNSASGGTVRGSLYLIKGEVKTTAGTAAVQNTAVTAVSGDTASTSCSISATSLSSGTFIAVKVAFNSGSLTNQSAGGVSLTTYLNVRRATREP